MVMFMAQALAWGVSRVLRTPRSAPFEHQELEHAHWDATNRRWFKHEDEAGGAVSRAA
jgi:hypothetical protein